MAVNGSCATCSGALCGGQVHLLPDASAQALLLRPGYRCLPSSLATMGMAGGQSNGQCGHSHSMGTTGRSLGKALSTLALANVISLLWAPVASPRVNMGGSGSRWRPAGEVIEPTWSVAAAASPEVVAPGLLAAGAAVFLPEWRPEAEGGAGPLPSAAVLEPGLSLKAEPQAEFSAASWTAVKVGQQSLQLWPKPG